MAIGIEDETELDAVTAAQDSGHSWCGRVEAVDKRARPARGVRLGQLDGRQQKELLGSDRHPDLERPATLRLEAAAVVLDQVIGRFRVAPTLHQRLDDPAPEALGHHRPQMERSGDEQLPLVPVGSEQELDVRRGPGADRIERWPLDQHSIDRRLPRQVAETRHVPVKRGALRLENALHRQLAQPPPAVSRNRERIEEATADVVRLVGCRDVCGGAARQDGPVVSAATAQPQMHSGAHCARRLAVDGDVLGIASESGDVLVHPLEGRDLVENADVRRRASIGGQPAQIEETESSEPVVEGDQHDSRACEPGPVVEKRGAGAEHVGTSVQIDHHRPASALGRRAPDVEIEAVFRDPAANHPEQLADRSRFGAHLRRHPGEVLRKPCSRPRLRWLGWREAELPNRGPGVGNTPKDADPLLDAAAHPALAGFDDRHLILRPRRSASDRFESADIARSTSRKARTAHTPMPACRLESSRPGRADPRCRGRTRPPAEGCRS